MEPGYKYCPGCHQDKAFAEFGKNASRSSGLQTVCKKCRSRRYYLNKVEDMNPKIFNSTMSALSAIERKVLDSLPYHEYASPSKVQATLLQKYGSKADHTKVLAILDGHVKRGLAIRTDNALFSRVLIKGPEAQRTTDVTEYADTSKKPMPVKEEKMPVENKKDNSLDGLRAITLKLLDVGKMISNIADELDTQITAIEKREQTSSAEMTKLRQLQALLKDLNG